ncbi:hypothetical protein [Herbiconiux daphne]|uniref:Uncharacterized protein n=1 Tax=Herbiconiux daphne TaxID=2970914 RepID=A0ABT2H4U7_9MICO|nr:hypothetical protein [Herbiconiux daphne]MCS5734965.1 hypothetical protein [Herbiconiux daphne]
MPSVDYFLSGDHEAARSLLAEALQSQGFTVTPEATGQWTVARGSQAMTVLFGGLAGSRQRLVYGVRFFDAEGRLVARFARDPGTGLMGGAIGINRANAVFGELDTVVSARLAAAGILTDAVRTA